MSQRRGQTLVLFALTMLLLTLLVLMTIGLGVRIHERTEQQVVADAAAYSQAVVTARTFNSVASLNRVMVAQMASVAAAQSLLSWAGFYHGTLNQARDVLKEATRDDAPAHCKNVLLQARDRIMDEDRRLIDIWEPAGGGYQGVMGHDVKAADYIRNDLYGAALQIALDQQVIYQHLKDRVAPDSGTGIAGEIALAARQSSPWRGEEEELFAGKKQAVTRRERNAVVLELQENPTDMVRATMATRGAERFISSREATKEIDGLSGADYVRIRINKVMGANPLEIILTNVGTSYFGQNGPTRSSGAAEIEGQDGQPINRTDWQKWEEVATKPNLTYRGSWAQDTGRFSFRWPNPPVGCSVITPTEDSFGYILTTGPHDHDDNHMWRRGYDADYREWNDSHVADPPVIRHSFRKEPSSGAPSIWPVFIDYQSSRLEEGGRPQDAARNIYGQPKSTVPIRRNYSVRSGDPWELSFKFNFAQGQKLNLKADRDPGRGLRRSTAIASAITYYHRGGHFKEPPNFLNPFWRATLVASDVDESFARRGDDVITTLEDNGEPLQAEALRLLRAQRFEAIP